MKNILYVLVIFTCSCSSQEVKISLSKIVLIDTFKNELRFDTANFISEAEFHPMFIGKRKDSILLNYNSRKIEQRNFDWDINRMSDSTDLNIYIDTTKIIGSAIQFIPLKYIEGKFESVTENYRGETKSYPVLIENTSTDTLTIGYGEYIPLIIEAVDSLGKWKPIQEPYTYFCGTGLTHTYIPPNQLLVTSCKLYSGKYLTKMRLAFGWRKFAYSNEFYGRMNYKQFEESPNIY